MHSIIFRLACCRPVVADRSKVGICSHVSCGRFYYYSVYICLREREYFSPTMSKITHFFAPTSSGSGKRSNASSTSGNNNNKDEEDEPLSDNRKWHLRGFKNPKFPGGACPHTPLGRTELRSFRERALLFKKSFSCYFTLLSCYFKY